MKICPNCEFLYPEDLTFCQKCNKSLIRLTRDNLGAFKIHDQSTRLRIREGGDSKKK